MITKSPTFCSVPWTSLNIDQTGRVFPCMLSFYELGNIKQQPIQDIIKGPALTEIKNTMAQEKWHTACQWCELMETTTGSSARTNRRVDDDVLTSIDQDYNYFCLQDLTINWSNLCNLTCTYCNPDTSTAWQAVKKIPIELVNNQHNSLIELVQAQGKNIKGLTLGGGEPLLQKSLPNFLNYLDPEKVRVLVTTNLSMDLTTNPVYQILKTWPNVNWQISFDNASKEKFEYVRRGASWEQFVANINLMKQDQQHISAHPAYSIYCALELEDYYKFCIDYDLDLFWCELSNPWDLDVRRYALPVRQLAIDQIDRVIELYGNTVSDRWALSTLNGYRKQLVDNGYIFNPEYQANPVRYHHTCEQERAYQHCFQDLWPDVAQHFNYD
jgi:radical SAM protein with 4Fe4S-binding SPASM domain